MVGRVKAYEAIVKGQNIPEPGVPESFKVLIKELQSIGLDIRVLSGDSKEIIIRDDDDDDDRAIRKKAKDMGVDVGNFGEHEVKVPEQDSESTPENIIAEDINADNNFPAQEPDTTKDLTDEELDAQLQRLSKLENAFNEDLGEENIDLNSAQDEEASNS